MRADKLPSTNTVRPLEIHIEELLLHGFPDIDRDQIRAIMEGELSRLFNQGHFPIRWHESAEVSCINGGHFEVKGYEEIEALSVRVAQNVYRSLTGGNF